MDCSAHALGEFPGGKKVAYREGRYVGYRYNEKFHVEPLFPFGYGLSYTEFSYRNLSVDDKEGVVSCYVKNTGDVAGSETVEVYGLSHRDDMPVKELKGFEKVFLMPGEEKYVKVHVGQVEEGYTYAAGSSLYDIRLK